MNYLLGDRWGVDLDDFDDDDFDMSDEEDELTLYDHLTYSLKYSGLATLAKEFLKYFILYMLSSLLPSAFVTLQNWAKLEMIFILSAIFIPIFTRPFVEDMTYVFVEIGLETVMWTVRIHFVCTSLIRHAQILYALKPAMEKFLKDAYFPHKYALHLYLYVFH